MTNTNALSAMTVLLRAIRLRRTRGNPPLLPPFVKGDIGGFEIAEIVPSTFTSFSVNSARNLALRNGNLTDAFVLALLHLMVVDHIHLVYKAGATQDGNIRTGNL